MPKSFEGELNARGLKFALVIGRFNSMISKQLLEGALDCILRHEGADVHQEIFWVPGSREMAPVVKRIIDSERFDGVICLGAVIRGNTPHFEYVAEEASKGIAKLSIESKIPVIFGVLTTDSIEQALERAGTKMGNKGWDAALAAIEMCNLYKAMS